MEGSAFPPDNTINIVFPVYDSLSANRLASAATPPGSVASFN